MGKRLQRLFQYFVENGTYVDARAVQLMYEENKYDGKRDERGREMQYGKMGGYTNTVDNVTLCEIS